MSHKDPMRNLIEHEIKNVDDNENSIKACENNLRSMERGVELIKTLVCFFFFFQRLANVSDESQRMHIIPPSTKYFYIKYTKKV